MAKRRIAVVLTDRANYGRLWPVMREIDKHPGLELSTICAGTMLLERFGQAEKIVEADGFRVDGRVYMELEGSVPATMAKSVGFGIVEFVSEYIRLKPDVLLVIGDRYEALAAVIAAAYQNITIAHIQGGEVSGSIDESARHAISKFSHYHFPSTARSAEYLVRMGEDPKCVFNFGCPAGDYIRELDTDVPQEVFGRYGVGAELDPDRPFLLVIYHPVTTEFGDEERQVQSLIDALDELEHPAIWLWPNIDAGADHISKALRRHRELRDSGAWLRLIKNLDPTTFQKVLKKCTCAVGNSSSFVRDTTFTGTPVVLVGDRQEGREVAENAVAVEANAEAIAEAVKKQLAHGRYGASSLYGEGGACPRIAAKLSELRLYAQKRLHYIHE